jgi:hypothetical protein
MGHFRVTCLLFMPIQFNKIKKNMSYNHSIKVSCLAFALAATMVFTASSQDLALGLKGGLNLTTLNADDPETTYDLRAGYHGGIFFRAKFSKVAIQPEVFLSTMSTDVESTFSRLAQKYQDNFTYLCVPVLVKFYLFHGLNIHAGPQFSFLLDGERKWENSLVTSATDIKDYYKNNDVSVSAGAGWDFGFGLNLDVRYNLGVKDINNFTNGEEVKSRVFQVSLGWNFLR